MDFSPKILIMLVVVVYIIFSVSKRLINQDLSVVTSGSAVESGIAEAGVGQPVGTGFPASAFPSSVQQREVMPSSVLRCDFVGDGQYLLITRTWENGSLANGIFVDWDGQKWFCKRE